MSPLARLRGALWHLLTLITETGTTSAEFQSSTMLLLLAAFAFAPWTDLNETIPFQRELLSLLSETAWGAVFFALGAAQSYVNIKRLSQPRMICAFLSASLFGYLSIVALMVHPVSLFLPVFAAASAAQAICFLVMSLARFRIKKTSGQFPKVRLNANA